MKLNLLNKTFIVSGSSKGIGLKIAENLLMEGSNVIITGRSKNIIKKQYKKLNLKFGSKVQYVDGDIKKNSVLKKIRKVLKKKWKKLDGIVANAGSVKMNVASFTSENDFNWYKNNFFMNAFKFVNYFINEIKKNQGSIIFISSIASLKNLNAPFGYASSKLSINLYSKFLANKLSKYNVRVNNIIPGNIYFKGGIWDKKIKKNPGKVKKMIKDLVPLRRFGKPEEIADLTTFLLSPKSNFITGAQIVIDGGQIIKR